MTSQQMCDAAIAAVTFIFLCGERSDPHKTAERMLLFEKIVSDHEVFDFLKAAFLERAPLVRINPGTFARGLKLRALATATVERWPHVHDHHNGA